MKQVSSKSGEAHGAVRKKAVAYLEYVSGKKRARRYQLEEASRGEAVEHGCQVVRSYEVRVHSLS